MVVAAKKVFVLGSAILAILGSLQGADSTWEGPGSDLASKTDWSQGLPNINSTDIGLFTNNGAPLNLILLSPLTLSNLLFDASSPSYDLNLDPPAALTITGDVTTEGSNQQTFLCIDSSINFTGNSPDAGLLFIDLAQATTGSSLQITGPVGTSVVLNEISASSLSTVTVINNNLTAPFSASSGNIALVNPSSSLTGSGLISGVISGNGSVLIPSGRALFLTSPNTYSGSTTVSDESTLIFEINGSLNPTGTLHFLGGLNGNFCEISIGAPVFMIGDLIGDGQNSSIFITGTTNFVAGTANNTVYNGGIGSPQGSFIKQGTGQLTLNGPVLMGQVDVYQGTLELNGEISGEFGPTNLTAHDQTTLKGNGTVVGQVNIMSGATMAPGNGLGTFNINGSYSQAAGTNYVVQIDKAFSSLTSISGSTGTALLDGGEVIVQPIGRIFFNSPYTILSATGGVTGTFAGVSATTNLFSPSLSYPGDAVLLELEPTFQNGAHTYNQHQVALQLNTLLSPNVTEGAVLGVLFELDPSQVGEAYDELSGNQYTSDPLAFSILNRQFIRRLYDPLRPIVTALPCERYDSGCADIWIEAGWNRTFLKNDGNGFGFNLKGWDLTGGAQKSFSDWTIGFAGSYAHDFMHYNLGGNGTFNSGFAGIYGLYRPDFFYVLADLAFGYTDNVTHRVLPLFNQNAGSTPQLRGVTFYLEGGIDIPFSCFLLQPFVGLEVLSSRRGYITESGFDGFDLIIDKRDDTLAMSRLGFHFSTNESAGFYVSLDGAWGYQLTRTHNDFRAHFAGFGDEFNIKGAKLSHHSLEGAITLTKDVTDSLQTYLEFSGEYWDRATAFNFLLGLQSRW